MRFEVGVSSRNESGFSELTNEYPLELLRISILDEKGLRTKNDYSWIHGNAEHSWGLLH